VGDHWRIPAVVCFLLHRLSASKNRLSAIQTLSLRYNGFTPPCGQVLPGRPRALPKTLLVDNVWLHQGPAQRIAGRATVHMFSAGISQVRPDLSTCSQARCRCGCRCAHCEKQSGFARGLFITESPMPNYRHLRDICVENGTVSSQKKVTQLCAGWRRNVMLQTVECNCIRKPMRIKAHYFLTSSQSSTVLLPSVLESTNLPAPNTRVKVKCLPMLLSSGDQEGRLY
jgi:hypothetical protein